MTIPSGPYIPERHTPDDPVLRESSVLDQLRLNDTGLAETVTIQSLDGTIEVVSTTIGNDSLVLTSAMQAAISGLSAVYQVILVSGTNLKTVNGTSLLGAGDLEITATDPDAQSSTIAYNSDGTIATKTLADGTVTTYTYTSGLLTQSDRAKTGELTIRKVLAYDSAGKLTTVTRTTF